MLIRKNTSNVFSSCCPFEKNMLSNDCLGFFGADAILAHAKTWDLDCENVPGISRTLRSALTSTEKVNTFKSPEMCLSYLNSDIAPDVYNYFSGIFSLF